MVTWIPFWLAEISLVLDGVEEHLKIAKPSAKSYLKLFTILLPKYLNILMFQAIFCRRPQLLDMLTQILNTESKFKAPRTKGKFTNLRKYLIFLPIVLLFFSRSGLRLLWFIRIFHSDSNALKNPSLDVYKGFGMKWIFGVNTLHSNKVLGYSLYIVGVWLYVTPRLMWVWFTVLLAAIIPTTLSVLVKKFEDLVRSINIKDENNRVNTKSVFDICRLFDHLKNMSLSVNLVWGNILLVWIIFISTRYAINMNIFTGSQDPTVVLETSIPFLSLCLLMYLSGNVYCKVNS